MKGNYYSNSHLAKKITNIIELYIFSIHRFDLQKVITFQDFTGRKGSFCSYH